MARDGAKRVVVGIDLGTTFSSIGTFDGGGRPVIVPNREGERICPSVVLFEKNEVIVGTLAKNSAVTAPERTVQFIKRSIGDADWTITIFDKVYTPETISALILKKLVRDAEERLGAKIEEGVITVPAYFNDVERKATEDAGRIAGLKVLATLNEPTAAALSYGLDKLGQDQTVLVYDLGGGTFDVTVIRIAGSSIEVLATAGERRLGGKDWDDELINYTAEKFLDEHRLDPRDDLESLQDLRNKAEEAKISLSRLPKTVLHCQCRGKSLNLEITREEFEQLTVPLLEQTETYLDIVLEKAGVGWADINTILLVGGSSKMPAVPAMIKRVSGKEPDRSINPDEVVTLGATIFAGMVKAQAAVKEGGPPPTELPEELLGLLDGVEVRNVNSHSLGIVAIVEGREKNCIMIPAQTPIPHEKRGTFGTAHDDQRTVKIRVVEGEGEDPEDCTLIGTCIISDLPPNRPKGSIIDVTYAYNANGRIQVIARDRQTNREVRTEIDRQGGLSESDVQREKAAVGRLGVA